MNVIDYAEVLKSEGCEVYEKMVGMARVLSFGVIGTGRMGRWHAKNIKLRVPGAKLIAVSDVDKAAAESAGRETAVPWYRDYRKLLAIEELDAVCIVTSSDTHATIATEAVERGLNVFVEKPMATTRQAADQLIRVVRRKGVKAQVGFMRRFDRAHSYAKERIDEGAIGRLTVFKSISRDPFPPPAWACDPRHGGGLQLEMHTHDYDLARWFMKSEVKTVFAKGECLVFSKLRRSVPQFVDHTLITLVFSNRALGLVEGSLNAKYGYDVRTEILGTDGMISIGRIQREPVTVVTTKGVNSETTFLGDRETPHFAQRFASAYLAEMVHFVRTINNDLPSDPGVKDGKAALDIGLAAFESTKSGRPSNVVS